MLRTQLDNVKNDLVQLLKKTSRDDFGDINKKNDQERFQVLFRQYLDLATETEELQELRQILKESSIYVEDAKKNMLVGRYLHLACAKNPRKCEDFSWIAYAYNYSFLKSQHKEIIEEAWLPLCQTIAQRVDYYRIFENGDSIKEILQEGISKEDLILIIDRTNKGTTLHKLAVEEWRKLPCVCRTDHKIEQETSSCEDQNEE